MALPCLLGLSRLLRESSGCDCRPARSGAGSRVLISSNVVFGFGPTLTSSVKQRRSANVARKLLYRNLYRKLSRHASDAERNTGTQPACRHLCVQRVAFVSRNGRYRDVAVVDRPAFRHAPHRPKIVYRVTRGRRAPRAVEASVGRRQHANATRVAATVGVAVSRGASGERRDGRVCPPGRPGSVAGVRASSLANARRSRVRVTPARSPSGLRRVRTALRGTRSACAPAASADCAVRFDLRSGSSKLSCDAKYNRNRCGGGRACGGAYWN